MDPRNSINIQWDSKTLNRNSEKFQGHSTSFLKPNSQNSTAGKNLRNQGICSFILCRRIAQTLRDCFVDDHLAFIFSQVHFSVILIKRIISLTGTKVPFEKVLWFFLVLVTDVCVCVCVCVCALPAVLSHITSPGATQGLKRVRAGGPLCGHFTWTTTWQVKDSRGPERTCVSHPISQLLSSVALAVSFPGLQASSKSCHFCQLKKVSLHSW